MRLICPNCGAQYEVPDDVIPETGRDLQCSNCGHTWFQLHPDHDAGLADDLGAPPPDDAWDGDPNPPRPEDDAHPDPAPETRRPADSTARRRLDPGVAEVLREEAEREARARAAESRAALESQPDLGLADPADDAPRQAQEARDRMARIRGIKADPDPDDPAEAEYADPIETGQSNRRDLLPDIDEINSSLRSSSDRKASAPAGTVAAKAQARRGGGFRRGFSLSLIVAAGLIALYAYAPQVTARVPAVAPYVDAYVGHVDRGRVWLDGQAKTVLSQLDAMSSEGSGSVETPQDGSADGGAETGD